MLEIEPHAAKGVEPGAAPSRPDGPDGKDERFVAVLELPPVVDAKTAVQVSIVRDIKAKNPKKR